MDVSGEVCALRCALRTTGERNSGAGVIRNFARALGLSARTCVGYLVSLNPMLMPVPKLQGRAPIWPSSARPARDPPNQLLRQSWKSEQWSIVKVGASCAHGRTQLRSAPLRNSTPLRLPKACSIPRSCSLSTVHLGQSVGRVDSTSGTECTEVSHCREGGQSGRDLRR